MRRLLLGALLGLAGPGWAHDVSADVSAGATTSSVDNPRSGQVGAGVSGSFDFSDAWSAWVGLGFTRDLATRTATSASPGSTVFQLSGGVAWLPTEHLSALLAGVFSPTAVQRSATTLTLPGARAPSADVVVESRTGSAGASLWLSWASNGLGDLESTVDVSGGATHFSAHQQVLLPSGTTGERLRSACLADPSLARCALVQGEDTPLWQGRLAAAYTALLFQRLDVGLEGAWYLYDVDPTRVGYFTLLMLGAGVDPGGGVPVLPYRFTLKPSLTGHLGRLTLRLGYQYGRYEGDLGAGHQLQLKATVKVARGLKLSLAATLQADASDAGALSNRGATAVLGGAYVF